MSKKTIASTGKKIKILIFCPSEIILSGILKALEPDSGIEITNVEKNTIETFMDSVKKLRPQVILFANTEPLPNMREICKAIKKRYQRSRVGRSSSFWGAFLPMKKSWASSTPEPGGILT